MPVHAFLIANREHVSKHGVTSHSHIVFVLTGIDVADAVDAVEKVPSPVTATELHT